MATVIFGGSVARQPVGGEMREFTAKVRIDGRTTPINDSATDLNKVMLIKSGWLVDKAFVNLITPGTTYGYVYLIDSNGNTYGNTFPHGGAAVINCTAGINGTAQKHPFLVDSIPASGPAYFSSDGDLRASFVGAGASFNGLMDVFVKIIDTNSNENAGVSWSSD